MKIVNVYGDCDVIRYEHADPLAQAAEERHAREDTHNWRQARLSLLESIVAGLLMLLILLTFVNLVLG